MLVLLESWKLELGWKQKPKVETGLVHVSVKDGNGTLQQLSHFSGMLFTNQGVGHTAWKCQQEVLCPVEGCGSLHHHDVGEKILSSVRVDGIFYAAAEVGIASFSQCKTTT
ncbi:hypothetical protein T05_6666 [Trichinella murrelli]|uniref:Uncharacterized protein n=1 Tax=Trichinella murrelli TaxID=144512 RepID=A0A0V0TKR4_9BILA|nr:hypothetical protein T05_6666 [Trichinella murrelli]